MTENININVIDKFEDLTPLDYAKIYGFDNIVQLFYSFVYQLRT